jgi:hypothetical protein
MTRTSLVASIAVACIGIAAPVRAAEKSHVVEVDGLKSTAPADWKPLEPTSRMRIYQFRVPRAAAEPADAQLTIFFFGKGSGGSAEANVRRWKGLFVPPSGKMIDDVAKVEKFNVGSVPVTYLDIEGTYRDKARPGDPNSPQELRPDYRFLGVIFQSPSGPYFLRLVGPAKTVGDQKHAFDEWLKAFK